MKESPRPAHGDNRHWQIEGMSDRQLIDWLRLGKNSSHPEIYKDHLPAGLEYVSSQQAWNCFDYAQGCMGKHWVDISELIPAPFVHGSLIIYFNGRKKEHAGRVVEGGRVVSQWDNGAVFRHRVLQVPSAYGRLYRTYEMPVITKAYRRFNP